jgi:hypothetical protein
MFFTEEDRGRQSIQMIAVTGGASRAIASGRSYLDDVQLSATADHDPHRAERVAAGGDLRASSGGGRASP